MEAEHPKLKESPWDTYTASTDGGTSPACDSTISCKIKEIYKPKKLTTVFSQPQQRHGQDGARFFSLTDTWPPTEHKEHDSRNKMHYQANVQPTSPLSGNSEKTRFRSGLGVIIRSSTLKVSLNHESQDDAR